MKTTTLYDEVIELIGAAQDIDDTTRESMIAEVRQNGLSPEMQERVMALFRSESADLGAAIERAQGIVEKATDVRKSSDAATLPESLQVGVDFTAATEDIATNLETACSKEAKSVDSAVGNALKQRDSAAADAIRRSLKG